MICIKCKKDAPDAPFCYWCGAPIELGNITSYCDACRQKMSKQATKNLTDKPLKSWKFGGALYGKEQSK